MLVTIPGSEQLPITNPGRPKIDARPFVAKALGKGELVAGAMESATTALTDFYDKLQKSRALQTFADADVAMQTMKQKYAASLLQKQNQPGDWAPQWSEQAKQYADQFMESDAIKWLTPLQKQQMSVNLKVWQADYEGELTNQAAHRQFELTTSSVLADALKDTSAGTEDGLAKGLKKVDMLKDTGHLDPSAAERQRELLRDHYSAQVVSSAVLANPIGADADKDDPKSALYKTLQSMKPEERLNRVRQIEEASKYKLALNGVAASVKVDNGEITTFAQVRELENLPVSAKGSADLKVSSEVADRLINRVRYGTPEDAEIGSKAKDDLLNLMPHAAESWATSALSDIWTDISWMGPSKLKTELTAQANHVQEMIQKKASEAEAPELTEAVKDLRGDAAELRNIVEKMPIDQALKTFYPNEANRKAAFNELRSKYPDDFNEAGEYIGTQKPGEPGARTELTNTLENVHRQEVNKLEATLRRMAKDPKNANQPAGWLKQQREELEKPHWGKVLHASFGETDALANPYRGEQPEAAGTGTSVKTVVQGGVTYILQSTDGGKTWSEAK